MTRTTIFRSIGLAYLALAVLGATAVPAAEYRALLDLDADPATGCTAITVEGPFAGVERIVTATVVGDQVTTVARRDCEAGSFGTPTAETLFPAPWPVGLGLGTGGADLVESYGALHAGGLVRLGFESDDGAGGTDALLTTDGSPGGAAIVVDFGMEEIPTLGPWLLLLLAVLMAAAGSWMLRRFPVAGRAALVVLLATTVTVGAVWAMVLLDGDPSDWLGLSAPALATASDPTADAPASADLRAGYAYADRAMGVLFLRFDATRDAPPTAAPQDVATDEDMPLLISLTGTDAEGATLGFAVDTPPVSGTLGAIVPTGPDSAEVTYTPAPDFFGADSFTFTVDDGLAISVPATVTIAVAAVNDAPTIGGGPFTAAFTEGVSGPVQVAAAATVTDPDDTDLASLTVTLTNLTDAGEEILSATPSGAIAAGDIAWLAPVLTIAPAGGAPLADFQAVLGSVTYEHTGDAPSETPDRTLALVADDGVTASAAAAATVTVAGTNDPPTLSTGHSAAFVEDDGAVAVAPTITVGDVDDGELSAATITLTSVLDGTLERLDATTCGGLTVTGSGTDTLSISGLATLAVYQSCLRSVTYENLSQAPTEMPERSVELMVEDADGAASSAVTSTVSVAGVNDPPAIGPDQHLVFAEDSPAPITVTGSDPEGDPLSIVVEQIVLSSAAVAGSFFSDPAVGSALAIGDTTTGLDLELTQTPDAFGNAFASLTYRLTDGSAQSTGTATVTIDVTPVDDVPRATLPSVLNVRQDGVLPFEMGGTSPEPDVWDCRLTQILNFNGELYLHLDATTTLPINSLITLPGFSDTTAWPMSFVPLPGTCSTDPSVPYNSFSYRFVQTNPSLASPEFHVDIFVHCPTGLLTIDDVNTVEGDTGTTSLTFTVALSGAVAGGFTVGYSTADGSATSADGDYDAAAGSLTFAGTDGESHTIAVTVNGDLTAEGDETFLVQLELPSSDDAGWSGGDNTGVGTIVNDD